MLALILFCGVFAVMGWGGLLHKVGATVIYPFQWVFDKVGDGISGFGSYFRDMDALLEENQALKEENAALRSQITDAEILADEQAWLYAYLSMKQEHTDYAMCAATVIASNTAKESGGYITGCTLNKGMAHGIERGMPVVTPQGLVGMVTEVSLNQCFVTTVLDTSLSVSSTVTATGEKGLLQGDFSCLFEGRAMLRYLAEDSKVEEGNILITGGEGSVYPYGIPVGRVHSLSVDPLSRTTCAEITPFCDLTSLSDVMILTDYVRYAEGEYEPQYGEEGGS